MAMTSIEAATSTQRYQSVVRHKAHRGNAHRSQRDLDQFGDIGAFAHDLRGPLANLSLLLEAIQGRSQARDEKVAAFATKGLQAIERIDGMISAMIVRSGAERGEPAMEWRDVNLPDVVETAAALNQPLAARHGVRLHCYLVEPLCVTGDCDLLLRAVDNLLTNAIKFSPPGGMIVCELGLVDGDAVIRIEDEGPGLTAQDIARAFRPFMTLTAKSDGPLGSHGLGLSIVRSIVERHGGTVTARNSQNGPGSVFELRLPRPTPSREPGE